VLPLHVCAPDALHTHTGHSQFNQAQRIGGDSGLTVRGEEYARLLPDVLESRLPAVSVWHVCGGGEGGLLWGRGVWARGGGGGGMQPV
jgi:hypothetical protein